jgi:glycosyltransferase involved in cell wall biosynthesis
MRQKLAEVGCRWSYINFSGRKKKFKTIASLLKFFNMVVCLCIEEDVSVIHCRSFPLVPIAVLLARFFNFRIILDTRGFWYRERVEAGSNRGFFASSSFEFAKKIELFLIKKSDHVIFQTSAGLSSAILDSGKDTTSKMSVIHNAADFDRFYIEDPDEKLLTKSFLQISPESVCLGYSGSLGFWYLLDEMVLFFSLFRKRYPNSKFIIVTTDDPAGLFDIIGRYGSELQRHIIIMSSLSDVRGNPFSVFDFSLCFIKKLPSKLASSPTKVGESLASGVPVIVNTGIGDLAALVPQIDAGWVIQDFSSEELTAVIQKLAILSSTERLALRSRASSVFSLDLAVERYYRIHSWYLSELK